MAKEPKIRVYHDDAYEIAFTVEYQDLKFDVSAYTPEFPNAQLAGTTRVGWCAGFPGSRTDLPAVASDLTWVAEAIRAIHTLGARAWVENAPKRPSALIK